MTLSDILSLKNFNLRDQVLLLTFFDNFNFRCTLFLKLCRQIVIFSKVFTVTENVKNKFNAIFVISRALLRDENFLSNYIDLMKNL